MKYKKKILHLHPDEEGKRKKRVTKKAYKITICSSIFCLLPCLSLAVMIGLSTEELAKNSDVVIRGWVENGESFWDEEGKTIFTRAFIKIEEVIRGELSEKEIYVEYEGGQVGDIALKVSDVAPLLRGEKVILFLRYQREKSGIPVFNIVGKGQGKYRIDSKGIARKGGFSIAVKGEVIDPALPVQELMKKIKEIEN